MESSCVTDGDEAGKSLLSACIPPNPGQLWSIILAGGNGDRIRDLVCRWKRRPIPKQYCNFVGLRSMLQHTIARAEMMGDRQHQLTVIVRDHQHEARAQLADMEPGRIVVQPANRDTFAGIFLPLTHVYARDLRATVVIYPSDHFVYPENRFRSVIQSAVQAVEERQQMFVLIGAPADIPELDYGWIFPGQAVWKSGESVVYSVKQFLEKPSLAEAVAAMACGSLWNTLIMVVKAHTLWQLGWRYFPEIMKHFERLYDAIGTSRENDVLEAIYALIPSQNFSKGLLTLAAKRIGVMPMEGILWSDWGREKRIVETLRLIGKKPNFPTVFSAGNPQISQIGECPSIVSKSVNF